MLTVAHSLMRLMSLVISDFFAVYFFWPQRSKFISRSLPVHVTERSAQESCSTCSNQQAPCSCLCRLISMLVFGAFGPCCGWMPVLVRPQALAHVDHEMHRIHLYPKRNETAVYGHVHAGVPVLLAGHSAEMGGQHASWLFSRALDICKTCESGSQAPKECLEMRPFQNHDRFAEPYKSAAQHEQESLKRLQFPRGTAVVRDGPMPVAALSIWTGI